MTTALSTEAPPSTEALRPTEATTVAEVGSGPVEELVDDELLVEDISIDGMCGVY